MPNDPTLDGSVQWRINSGALSWQEPDYRTIVDAILSAGLATEVVGLISAGKEANVYLARFRGAPLAIKAYRLYRTSHRGGRPVKVDSMSWLASHEFEMLRQAWKASVRVPTPARRVENFLSMRYLGTEDGPAPRLKDVRLEDPDGFLEKVLGSIDALTDAGVVHGDLSAYNVLVHDEEPWLIDLSEAVRVDRLGTAPWRRLAEARGLLARGFDALETYFRKYSVSIDRDSHVRRLLRRIDRSGALDEVDI